MAAYGAYLLLVIVFILLSLIFMFLVVGRRRAVNGSLSTGSKVLAITPAAIFAGLGVEGHTGWALGLSIAVVLFSMWWLNNMAKREP